MKTIKFKIYGNQFYDNFSWVLENGEVIWFLLDQWLGDESLAEKWSRIYSNAIEKSMRLGEICQWKMISGNERQIGGDHGLSGKD